MTSNDLVASRFGDHARPLGLCWVVYGVIRLAMTFLLVSFAGTATLMFGALLSRVADPFTLMATFHFFYAAAVVLSAACGLIGLVAGLALLGSQRSARTLCLIAGFLSLPNIPLGTTLGIYTLIVCFR